MTTAHLTGRLTNRGLSAYASRFHIEFVRNPFGWEDFITHGKNDKDTKLITTFTRMERDRFIEHRGTTGVKTDSKVTANKSPGPYAVFRPEQPDKIEISSQKARTGIFRGELIETPRKNISDDFLTTIKGEFSIGKVGHKHQYVPFDGAFFRKSLVIAGLDFNGVDNPVYDFTLHFTLPAEYLKAKKAIAIRYTGALSAGYSEMGLPKLGRLVRQAKFTSVLLRHIFTQPEMYKKIAKAKKLSSFLVPLAVGAVGLSGLANIAKASAQDENTFGKRARKELVNTAIDLADITTNPLPDFGYTAERLKKWVGEELA